MYDDILHSLQRKIGRDECEAAVREFQDAANFVAENWKDPIGTEFYAKLQLLEGELQSLEKRRSRLILQMEDMKDRLQKIVDDADGDPQKRRVKTYPHPTGDSYSSGGGRKRN